MYCLVVGGSVATRDHVGLTGGGLYGGTRLLGGRCTSGTSNGSSRRSKMKLLTDARFGINSVSHSSVTLLRCTSVGLMDVTKGAGSMQRNKIVMQLML